MKEKNLITKVVIKPIEGALDSAAKVVKKVVDATQMTDKDFEDAGVRLSADRYPAVDQDRSQS